MPQELDRLLELSGQSLRLDGAAVVVLDPTGLRARIEKLVESSALTSGAEAGWARYLIRWAALELGIVPASIHDLYLARGRGEIPTTFTVPAINLRALSFHAARAVFRAARKLDAGAFIFEIARSEIGYTAQRPAEYVTNVLAAAIAERYAGPVIIQGDHFQISAKRYAADPDAELLAVQELAREAINAGFFNIDVDTSTLVDLDKDTTHEQQRVNFELSARISAFLRAHQPAGVTLSVGGEIGEVGGRNSNEAELRAYMDGYLAELKAQSPGLPGLSKISIQTGTSHGGTVLPNGSIAKVDVDFETLRHLSTVARNGYQLGGAVQHGASTLPEDAFGRFVQSEAVEVHLATNFMTMFYEHLPSEFRMEIYDWLDEHHAAERKAGMTPEQFYYKTRKNAIGPFKAQAYALPEAVKDAMGAAWEGQFERLFALLGLKDTRRYVEKYVPPIAVRPRLADYVQGARAAEQVSDLAD
jgi:fructose/tagatose bisphosphate aldolase